jgi:hypothetical protein
MNRFGKSALLILTGLVASCSGSNSTTESASVPLTSGVEITPVSLSQDLGEVKGDILKLEKFLWADCLGNCAGPKVKKLISTKKVNASTLENKIFGFDKTGGYSWDKLKYFGGQTSKSFLDDFLKNQIIYFNVDKLCALIEVLPTGLDGRFLEGEFQINTSNFPIEEKCGVLPATLNMDGTITVEDTQDGSFEKIIRFNGEEIHFGDNPDKFVYGEFSSDKRKRLTVDKDKLTLSLETVILTSGKDSLVRIYFDETTGESSMLVNHTGSESVQFTYATEISEDIIRFGKLNIRADSLGGVETSSPQATACIDLSTGLISAYDYASCPVVSGLSINQSNPALFVLYFPALPVIRSELNYLTEHDIFMEDI